MTNENQPEGGEFERFNGLNFQNFRYALMLKLRAHRLIGIVLGTETKPEMK
jgi:hypothetical protein